MNSGASINLTGGDNPILIIKNNHKPLVSVHPDGRVEYHADVEPDEAAKKFWEAMAFCSPIRQYVESLEKMALRQAARVDEGDEYATLRQQAARVDEGRVQQAMDAYVAEAGTVEDLHGNPLVPIDNDAMRAALEAALSAQPAPHPDDAAVDAFAAAMKAKLAGARAKGRGGWESKDECSQQQLSDMLRAHVEKGDPRDVANFCMFLHQRGEAIQPAPERQGVIHHVGDSLFESWFSEYDPSNVGLKQVARDSYAAGIAEQAERLAAHPAAPVGVPDGWKFRAIPGGSDTVEVVGPNGEEWWIASDHRMHSLAKALLAAAPSAPLAGEQVGWDDTRRLQFVLDHVPHSVLADFGVLPENWMELAEGEAHISDARACIDANLAAAPSAPQGTEERK